MKVFVYGSLKSGNWNNTVLGDSEKVADGETEENFVLTDCGFPYMVPESDCEGRTEAKRLPVVGEVYEVTKDAVMRALDGLEGVAYGHYKHRLVNIKGVGECLAYVPVDPDSALRYRTCEENEGKYLWS